MAQPEKRENSVLFSLRELRQIEENRVQEEEHAVRSAEETRVMAQQAEEKRRRDSEEAKARAEREELLRIEQAREGAEREARLRVETAEATERQRNQAALEQQRLQQEMELRRADIAKKRPTWMLAVMGISIVAAVALIFFAVQWKNKSSASDDEAAAQRAIASEAVKNAQEAQDKVEKLSRDLTDLNLKVNTAVDSVVAAQTDADRATAKGRLQALRQEQQDMEARIAAAKAAAARAERLKGVHVSDECKNNPLAKGC